ncbi:hypothetical protein BGZ46_004008 [Entomortierella lignicola]|nr:hypothetical protein BGZ46_004008 [Entomortierella lignicola]
MKFSCTLSILAFSGLMLQTIIPQTSALPTSKSHAKASTSSFSSSGRAAFSVPMTSSDPAQDFIIPNGKGPAQWSCSYTTNSIQPKGGYTSIAIGKDSSLKPFSCGELISRETNLNYGTYSVDMISTSIVGHVTGFFLITTDGTELDVELTGLNSSIVHLNVWDGSTQTPSPISLGFDASKDWHNYAIEWRENSITWYVDGKMVLNRNGVTTRNPKTSDYKVVLNSWTDNVNDHWAGKFVWPGDKAASQFKNLKYTP